MLTATWQRGKRFVAECRGHKIVVDQPRDKGGADEGPTPPELLIASLASCVGVYALSFFERRRLSTEGMAVSARWEGASGPARIGRIELHLLLPHAVRGALRQEDLEVLRRTAEACYVHHTLAHPPEITLELEPGSPRPLPDPA